METLNNTAVAPASNTDVAQMEGPNMVLKMPSTDQLAKLQNMEEQISLNVKYKRQEEWQALINNPVKCFYLGLKEIPNDEGDMVTCAVFASQRETFLSGQMLLIDAVRRLKSNTPLCITYRGKKKNKSSKGSTNMFDVVTLG